MRTLINWGKQILPFAQAERYAIATVRLDRQAAAARRSPYAANYTCDHFGRVSSSRGRCFFVPSQSPPSKNETSTIIGTDFVFFCHSFPLLSCLLPSRYSFPPQQLRPDFGAGEFTNLDNDAVRPSINDLSICAH